jgi:putative transcriptional regulator
MKSLEGRLLLASPELRDPNFLQTVLLMVTHNDDGAFGLVLNRPLKVRLQEVWGQVAPTPAARNDVIYLGGPCEGPLMALHDEPNFGGSEVIAGLHFSTERDLLAQLVADPSRNAKFFAGFSGWGPGQLEGEMEEGSWLTLPAVATHIYDTADDLWAVLMRDVHGRQILDALHIRHVPPDLRMN